MSFCDKCIAGVRHEGTPTGKVEEINGVKTYVALPENDYPKDKAIIFCTDVFGLDLPNNLLLADDFAKNGFQVYVPDYLHDDPVPGDFLGGKFDLMKWFPDHTQEKTRPPLDKVIAALKEKGVTSFGAIGYCFGARYVFDLAFDKVTKASVVNHPTFIEAPKDHEAYKATGIPLLINSCEVDQQYPAEKQKIGDEVLGGGKMKAEGYERLYWAGCEHGFSVRGDMTKPEVKAGKEGAFKAAVEWFIKYL